MKYQIYLDKHSSELINYLAESGNMKPSTFIKAVMEEFAVKAEPQLYTIVKELREKNTNERSPK